MAVHGEKQKIRHKNMTDGVVKNGGCHDEQKKIYIYIIINNQVPTPNKLIEIEKNNGLHTNKLKKLKKFHGWQK